MAESAGVVHVIDDDEAVRESLEALLVVAGYEVSTYASAEEFLSRAPEARGCLLVDVHMPGMSGLDLLERLRVLGRRSPAVVLTASRDEPVRERALSLGVERFLTKPAPRDDLLEAIRTAGGA